MDPESTQRSFRDFVQRILSMSSQFIKSSFSDLLSELCDRRRKTNAATRAALPPRQVHRLLGSGWKGRSGACCAGESYTLNPTPATLWPAQFTMRGGQGYRPTRQKLGTESVAEGKRYRVGENQSWRPNKKVPNYVRFTF